MGMKSKVMGASMGGLSVGVHPVTITDFRGHKDSNGSYIFNKSGDNGFSVTFECKEKGKYTDTFWYSKKSLWRLRKLFKAILMDRKTVNYSDIIGKELWLYIAKEYINEDKVKNPDNYLLSVFDFSPMTESRVKPAIIGDPEDNKGVASGVFIIERHLELKSIEMPKPIEGDSKEFLSAGVTPNMDFFEEESPFEEKPELSGFPSDLEEEEGF